MGCMSLLRFILCSMICIMLHIPCYMYEEIAYIIIKLGQNSKATTSTLLYQKCHVR